MGLVVGLQRHMWWWCQRADSYHALLLLKCKSCKGQAGMSDIKGPFVVCQYGLSWAYQAFCKWNRVKVLRKIIGNNKGVISVAQTGLGESCPALTEVPEQPAGVCG